MNLKKSGDSTGFEPMTSAMPVQCSNQLSYEVTQLRADQLVGLMFSREIPFTRIISSFDFKHRTSYNISFILHDSLSENVLLFFIISATDMLTSLTISGPYIAPYHCT